MSSEDEIHPLHPLKAAGALSESTDTAELRTGALAAYGHACACYRDALSVVPHNQERLREAYKSSMLYALCESRRLDLDERMRAASQVGFETMRLKVEGNRAS